MKNSFNDNLWRKIWIGNEVFDSSYCETCYIEAEEWAKEDHPRLKDDKLVEKTLDLLDEHYFGVMVQKSFLLVTAMNAALLLLILAMEVC